MLRRDGRLDEARRRRENIQRSQRKRDAVRDGKSTPKEEKTAHRAAEKQEAHEE
jgi:hypothetical protein